MDNEPDTQFKILLASAALAAILSAVPGCLMNGQMTFSPLQGAGGNGQGGPSGGGCGPNGMCGPPPIPPTAGYKGYLIDSIQVNANPVVPLGVAASTGAGAPELSGSTALTPAELAAASQPLAASAGGAPPVATLVDGAYFSVTGPTGSIPARAVIQLQWDASQLNLAQTPYAMLMMDMHGGDEGPSCPAANGSSSFGVTSGLFDALKGYWIPASQGQDWTGVPQWNWGGGQFPISLKDALITKSDGKSYVVVNVESTYASEGACPSSVHVAGAGLAMMSTLSSVGSCMNCGGIILSSTAPAIYPQNGGLPTYQVPAGVAASFFVGGGGTPPYTFSIAAGAGTIDPVTGHFVAGANPGSATIQVTDAKAVIQTAPVNVLSPGTVLGLNISSPAGPNPVTITAGSCLQVDANPVGYNDSLVPAPTGGITLGSMFNPVYPLGNGGCTGATGAGTIPQGTTSGGFYVPLNTAGNYPIGVSGAYSPSGNVPGNSLEMTVKAAAVNTLAFAGTTNTSPPPAVTNAGQCTPLQICAEDPYGNPNTLQTIAPTGNPYEYTNGFSSGGATFYSNSGCTTATANYPGNTVNLYAASTCAPIYYKTIATYAGNDSLSINMAGTAIGTKGTTILVENPHSATMLKVSQAAGAAGPSNCVTYSVAATTMDGTAIGMTEPVDSTTVSDPVTARTLMVNAWGVAGGMGGELFSSTNCAAGTQVPGSLTLSSVNLNSGPVQFSVLFPPQLHGTFQLLVNDHTTAGSPPYLLNYFSTSPSW